MKRRNFFKNLLATVFGINLASKKTAKAEEKPQIGLNLDDLRQELQNAKYINKALFFKLFDKLEGRETPTAAAENSALRFNENRIEAWTGKKWVNVVTVDVLDVVFPWDEPGGLLITVSEPGLTHVSQRDCIKNLKIPSPTAEQNIYEQKSRELKEFTDRIVTPGEIRGLPRAKNDINIKDLTGGVWEQDGG